MILRLVHLCIVFFMAVGPLRVAAETQPQVNPAQKKSPPTVTLSYDETGDFGPQTPQTTTSGWQEAINYCVAHKHDLYAKGGWGGQGAIYHVRDTIHIPATQDFKIDGGIYVINWEGPAEKDLLRVDSGMDCHFNFGILVYGGLGAALRIKPVNPVPIDNFAVFADSEIRTSSIADPHPFQRGERQGGAGVVFDTSNAAIIHSDFYFTAVLNFKTCIDTPAAGSDFAYNQIDCVHLHTNADNSTLLKVGNRSMQNRFQTRIGVDQGAAGVQGVAVSGSNNKFDLTTRGGFPRAQDLLLEESAEGNQINLIPGRSTTNIADLITDKAAKPTNQLSCAAAPAPIQQIKASVGTSVYTQRLYPAAVRIVGGKVSDVVLIRGSERLSYGAAPAGDLFLSVGDQLQVTNTTPPTLQVVPLKLN